MVGRVFGDVMPGRLRQPCLLRQENDPVFAGPLKPVQNMLVLRNVVLVNEQDIHLPRRCNAVVLTPILMSGFTKEDKAP